MKTFLSPFKKYNEHKNHNINFFYKKYTTWFNNFQRHVNQKHDISSFFLINMVLLAHNKGECLGE